MSYFTGVFTESDVQDAMKRVFYSPMRANSMRKCLYIAVKTRDVITRFLGLLISNNACRCYKTNPFDHAPLRVIFFKPIYFRAKTIFSDFNTTMIFLGSFMKINRNIFKIIFCFKLKKCFYVFMQ